MKAGMSAFSGGLLRRRDRSGIRHIDEQRQVLLAHLGQHEGAERATPRVKATSSVICSSISGFTALV